LLFRNRSGFGGGIKRMISQSRGSSFEREDPDTEKGDFMKAAVLYEIGKGLVVEDLEFPRPREGEVLVKMAASGVCHSDLVRINGKRPLPMPIVLGHEGAGVVEEVGLGVKELTAGDHVVLSWITPCGQCRYCVSGKPNLCTTAVSNAARGVMPDGTKRFRKGELEIHHMYGISTFAEYSVVSERAAVKIRRDVNLQTAALIGCAVMTGIGAVINTAKVKPGARAAVFGAGGVGLNVIQGCGLVNAEMIVAVDVLDEKLNFAKQFGATHVINAKETDVIQTLRDLTNGEGVDYSFDAVGAPQTTLQAFEGTCKGGMVVVIGIAPAGVNMAIPGLGLTFAEKMVMGSFYGSCVPKLDFPRMADFYASRRIKLDELITGTFSIERINEAFHELEHGRSARSLITFR
jgi:S-(hydroxymethyl)glutathione dehydrogenase / alcohol dehydrogenase